MLELQVVGRVGVPDDAQSVVLNVTSDAALERGFVTVFPCGLAVPNASNLNYAVGQTVANAVITRVGARPTISTVFDARRAVPVTSTDRPFVAASEVLTQCSNGSADRGVSSEQLAIYGGDRAVTVPFKEHWRQVRLRDLVPLAWYVARGVNTMPSGAGPVGGFERRFATLTGARFVLLMNSGTAALHSAFFAVGVKPGDEVIVPPYTFYASAGPVLHLGGVPVFCDIDEVTLTADPDDVESRITPRTRAICVVHVWGNPARLDRFVEIARRHGVALIEDCSHAHGASYQGRSVGTWGDIGCYSLQGNKPVSGGEAGVAITENPVYFDRMLALAHNGRTSTQQAAGTFDIDDVSFGLKYRPHLAAAQWALNGLGRLDELNARRARNYRVLVEAIGETKAITPVGTYPDATRGGYFEFVFRYDPDLAGGWPVGSFALAAQAEGVPINVDRYTRQGRRAGLLHEAPVFSEVDFESLGGFLGGPTRGQPIDGRGAPLRVAEHLADRLLTLPPFTAVAEDLVHQCGIALRKVADGAAGMADPRTGT